MFKIITLLVLYNFSYSQAFNCEFPCPENSICTAEDKCTCSYGYKEKISDFDGLPYCQWQGRTTIKKATTDLTVEPKIHETNEDDLVDDNSELFGDYRYQKEQHDIDIEEEVKKQRQKTPNFFKANRFAISRDATTSEEATESPVSVMTPNTNLQQQYPVFPFVKLRNELQSYGDQEDDESDSFKKLLLENEISRRYYSNKEEKTTNTILNNNFKLNPMETTNTFIKPELDTFTFPTFLRKTTAEETTDATHVVKVIKHVEQRIHSGSAVTKFYTSLGVFCTFLAFLFAVTVLFDCVKL